MSKLTHTADGQELCSACAPDSEEENHPPGMVFVGWGHGWQPCGSCGGSGLARTQHCEDTHCELPRGHAGVHRMGLYIRVPRGA